MGAEEVGEKEEIKGGDKTVANREGNKGRTQKFSGNFLSGTKKTKRRKSHILVYYQPGALTPL